MEFLISRTNEYKNEHEIMGNLYFFTAEIYFLKKMPEESKKYYSLARDNFKKVFPEGHNVFKIIDKSIERLSK
jgi:hypothetical protein